MSDASGLRSIVDAVQPITDPITEAARALATAYVAADVPERVIGDPLRAV